MKTRNTLTGFAATLLILITISLAGTVRAATAKWSHPLTDNVVGYQLAADGTGGVACIALSSAAVNSLTYTILWLDSKGNQIYMRTLTIDSGHSAQFHIVAVVGHTFVYTAVVNDQPSQIVQVDRQGRETTTTADSNQGFIPPYTTFSCCSGNNLGYGSPVYDNSGFFVVKSAFNFMKRFSMFATLAAASGGSAPSR